MSDKRELRVENPKLCAQFDDWLRRQDAPLPWTFGADIGEIVDADGVTVFSVPLIDTVDGRERAGQISAAILTAVNTCGGYRAT